jgi:hypothetical protein
VSSTHLGLTTRFLVLSHSFRLVDVGRSLWRENESAVCNCCWSESRGTRDHILLSQTRDSPNLEGQVPVFIPPGTGFPSLLVASYDSQGYGRGIRTLLHAGLTAEYYQSRTLTKLTLALTYKILARTTQKPQLFHCYNPTVTFLIICWLATGTCLPSRCPETALVYPPISRSFHIHGSTRYSTISRRRVTIEKLCVLFVGDGNVGLYISFDNAYEWKGIRKKAEEVISTKAYITNDKTSRWILIEYYFSMYP